MFEKARLKLTAWYLLIIMLVSFLFSLFIFQVADRELQRIDRRQQVLRDRYRIEIFRSGFTEEFNFPVEVGELRDRIILMLVLVDGVILLISGGAGYFLAGKTLKPIKDMVTEQNRFISDASHEFRTPLTSLKSAMEVHLRDKKLTLVQARTLITDNINEVNKLQKLSDRLLHLTQYQNPDPQIYYQKLNLKKSVSEALAKVKYLADKGNIKLQNLSKSIEIMGNRDKLVDLFVILLDNAIKYSPSEKTVSIKSEKKDNMALITVIDNGLGIDKKDIPFIFDRFYRADNSRSKKTADGYGLGLSIAKKIVELHNGKISVNSTRGKGSAFKVCIPVKYAGKI